MANKASKHSEIPLHRSSKDIKARSGAAITGMCILSKPSQYYLGAGFGVRLKKQVTFGDGGRLGISLPHMEASYLFKDSSVL